MRIGALGTVNVFTIIYLNLEVIRYEVATQKIRVARHPSSVRYLEYLRISTVAGTEAHDASLNPSTSTVTPSLNRPPVSSGGTRNFHT